MKLCNLFLGVLALSSGLSSAHAQQGAAVGPGPVEPLGSVQSVRRPATIGVWRYSLDPADRKRETQVSYGRHSGVRVDSIPGAGDLGLVLSNAVSQSLLESRRFEVVSRAALEEVSDEDWQTNATYALEAGRRLGLDFIVYGDVESATTDMERIETEVKEKCGKFKSLNVKYVAKVRASIHHVAIDVKAAKILKETRDVLSREETLHSRPGDGVWRSMLSRIAGTTSQRFVRNLVPERKGRVLAVREDGTLVLNLGRVDGVGEDTDFWFERVETVRDKLGAEVLDETGQALVRRVSVTAAPSSKHKPMNSAGRPLQIEDEFTIVSVGYRGSGGFLGLDNKFKTSDVMGRAIRVGDMAVLAPKVGK